MLGEPLHKIRIRSNYQLHTFSDNAMHWVEASDVTSTIKLKESSPLKSVQVYVSFPVSLFLSSEFLGLSSSSDHLSPSSPTAKIVSPSKDSLGLGEGILCAGFGGGLGERPRFVDPLGTGVLFSSGVRPSSSSRESARERISKPSSS
jgi:hypothetical protein